MAYILDWKSFMMSRNLSYTSLLFSKRFLTCSKHTMHKNHIRVLMMPCVCTNTLMQDPVVHSTRGDCVRVEQCFEG